MAGAALPRSNGGVADRVVRGHAVVPRTPTSGGPRRTRRKERTITKPAWSKILFGGAASVALALALDGASAGDEPPEALRPSPIVLTASEHQAAEEFEARVRTYRALQKKLEATLPKLSRRATPQQVDANQRALGVLIKNARAGAARGELLTPDMQALVKRILDAVLAGADGKTIKASIMDENPGVPNLSVNDRYPDSIPLSTMPPQVLKALPKLEEELEYRFIGERLVLMDARAHIIVDFTDDVLR